MAASASASSGGTKAGNGGASPPAGTTNVGQPVPTPVGSTQGTLVFTPANVIAGQTTVASGTLASSDAGQPVALEIQEKSTVWAAVASSIVGPDGSYSISWRVTKITAGSYSMRVVSGALASSATSVSTPEAPLGVLRAVIATWYGPGFYGHKTACGETLTRYIVGVAHRNLPCGTPVTLYYNSQSITVPVIDRGPYANGATFDLTSATAQALGITETVNVGFTAARGEQLAAFNWYPPGLTGPTGTTGISGTTGTSGTSGTTGTSDGGGATAP
jgi:rare lipoprotein A (peptidoglycan hydrolase)